MIKQAERTRTGIAGLDDILMGGLLPNRLYLVAGDPGSGKTTLALQFLLEGKRAGERCLYITLSETKEELTAGAVSHGWDLSGINIVELVSEDGDPSSTEHITMYNPSEVELSETTKAVLDAVKRHNPVRVVFDSLSEFRLLAQSSLRYRRQILALKQFFVGRKCTILLLDDGTSEADDLQLQSIAHGVIALDQLAPVYGAERRRLRIIKLRGTGYRGGYHDFTVGAVGLEIFPRLVSAEHVHAFAPGKVPSGVHALDALLGGGPDRGTSTLLMGPAGSGKSTIAIQYAAAAAQRGERAVIFAFDESVTTMTLRTKSIGLDLTEYLQSGRIIVQTVDPAELSPGEFAHSVREAVEKEDARIVVIDSLNGYLNAMPEEHFLTAQMHELLTYLGKRGVTTFLVVAQHGLVGSNVYSPVDTSYLADSVVLFRYFENAGRVKKAISVIKKRSGLHEESIRELTLDKNGVRLSKPLTNFQGILSGVPVEAANAEPSGRA